MKGMVFTLFNELVEEKFGFDTWDKILETVHPPSDGVYTAGQSYPDEELLSLVAALSDETKVDVPTLVKTFGQFMFPHLAKAYPSFIEPHSSLKSFIKTVDDVVHVEVRKLFPDASLPGMQFDDPAENKLILIYKSPRKLCHLGEGLIVGASEHFKQSVQIEQPKCLHQGDEHCRIEMTFES